ncbi:MAG: 5'/3'-nucleotidase SurE [Natronomonas sp.]
MDVLLTNDDGIDAVGIRAMYEALDEIADVTVIAPAEDQSAVGRQLSSRVDLYQHELGYAVKGTPTDCVVAAAGAFELEFDLVVSGCNRGANLGEYVLGRSGTVSAAVEATFFGIPAIAASVYFPAGDLTYEEFNPTVDDFLEATRASRYLVEHGFEVGIFDTVDYLNLNAPLPANTGPASMEITQPSHVYEMDANRTEDGGITITDRIWELMAYDEIPDPPGTDRRAVVEGRISVSPLTAPHTSLDHAILDRLAEDYGP